MNERFHGYLSIWEDDKDMVCMTAQGASRTHMTPANAMSIDAQTMYRGLRSRE
jgi:hypothetical protein